MQWALRPDSLEVHGISFTSLREISKKGELRNSPNPIFSQWARMVFEKKQIDTYMLEDVVVLFMYLRRTVGLGLFHKSFGPPSSRIIDVGWFFGYISIQ